MGRAGLAARAAGWACSGSLALCAAASGAPALVKVGDFSSPTYATGAPDSPDRVFVTERAGTVRVVDGGTVKTFLDLASVTLTDGAERGLLSMAFAPDYATSGRFYVYMTVKAASAVSGTDGEIQVREYRRSPGDPDAADPASARLLLSIPHNEAPNHNGGQLQFGPDGKLWLGTGDGGGGNNQFGHAQDPASLLGKLIRLDPEAPSPEIVAVGLRNPWRFSFDRASGQLTIGDVGQGAWEEIDAGLAGNYGWSCFEGSHPGPTPDPRCARGTAMPALALAPSDASCSVIGGYVLRAPGLPTLLGRYLYGDNCAAPLRSLHLAAAGSDAPVGLSVAQLSSFGQDVCGLLFVVSLAGSVSRLVDGAPSPCGMPPAPPAVVPPADTRPCSLAL